MAEDKLTVEAVTIPQGGSAEMSVVLENPDTKFAGFQFELTLPTGVDIAKEDDEAIIGIGDRLSGTSFKNFTITATPIKSDDESQTYQILGYQTVTAAFPETTGCIMTVMLKANSDLAIGTKLTATLTKVQLSDPESVSYDLADVTFDITIDEPGLKFDENSTKLPVYKAGETSDVTMIRTITKGEWSTIVLPFTLPQAKAKLAFGDDVQLYEFSGFQVNYGDDEENVIPLEIKINLSSYTLGPKKPMTGGKPFLIKTSKDIESFKAEAVTLVSEVTDASQKDEFETPGKLTGTFVKTKIPADGIFLSGDKFWYSTGNTNVKAFRCWFELGAVLDKPTNFEARVTLNFDDNEASGISDVMDGQFAEGKYYDLQGRPVLKPANGIYIKDGKKVVVK
jgi:hypothetical protein